MAQVMIRIDPHKRSHTAVAVDDKEVEVDRLIVKSSQDQATQLRGWADHLEVRSWAVESPAGLGYLVAQQLVAAGEEVVDVPPHLAARVRVLDSASTDKTDANDARSIAICAWRHTRLNTVTAPIEASSTSKTRVRLNTGGNRRINHVLHIAAVNQLRRQDPGRTYLDPKLAEGKSSKEAIRASKRRISDAVWRQLRHDAANKI